MKKTMMSLMTLAFCTLGQAQNPQLSINLSGNSYITTAHEGGRITPQGLSEWSSPKTIASTYFYVDQPTTAELSIMAKGNSTIVVAYGKKRFKVKLNNEVLTPIKVGKINIKEAGYVQIDIQGVSKQDDNFGEITQLLVNNLTAKTNYVKEFSDYWGRRGPSVHLGYSQPKGNTEWFYNEITVPKVGEVMHSYYMAAGFGEGYFGMQYNSPSERRVLFSVWSPFDTQDPRLIPEEQKIKLLRRGEGVHIGEFGNEGSGGQSFLRYDWKADTTYKFLMQVRPDGAGNTCYTAYFYATDENKWRLIASFLRPQTNTWYKGAHSFLENFSPEQGYLTREVKFGNPWTVSTQGEWQRVTEANFTHDATAHAKVRLDYQGGKMESENLFYLKMGGFFNQSTPMNTKFHISPTGLQPQIDFAALEQL